jgi:hypothetical protein
VEFIGAKKSLGRDSADVSHAILYRTYADVAPTKEKHFDGVIYRSLEVRLEPE